MPLPWLEKSGRRSWTAGLVVALAALGLTLAVAHTGRVRPLAAQDARAFDEAFVPQRQAGPLDPERAVEAPPTGALKLDPVPDEKYFSIQAAGGASYFDTNSDTSFGGLYGAQISFPLVGGLGGMVNGSINHYSGGTQYGGSFGLGSAGGNHGGILGRFGWMITVDQFTDTGLDNPYLVLGRYQVTLPVTRFSTLGVSYADPYHGDNARIPLPGGATSASVPLAPVETVEAFLHVGNDSSNYTRLSAGYQDAFEAMTYRAQTAIPWNERISTVLSGSYTAKVDLWTAYAGLSIDISPRRSGGMPVAANGCGCNKSRDTVRGGLPFLGYMFDQMSSPTPLGNTFGADDYVDPFGTNPFNPAQQMQNQQAAIAQFLQQLNAELAAAANCNCPAGTFLVCGGGGCSCCATAMGGLPCTACP